MNQAGARFLAESEIWRAAEAETAGTAAPEPEPGAALAPLGETAAGHMTAPALARFLGWRRGLPKGDDE